MLLTSDDVRRHIGLKLAAHELPAPVAHRMLAALDGGAVPDYVALRESATFIDPPALVYHTAPTSDRRKIRGHGLIVCQPGKGGAWAPDREICKMLQAAQPPGVYVTAEPDSRGVFAHWPAWDVWEVRRLDLPWRHDRLNPGCWSLSQDVPEQQVRLSGTFGRACEAGKLGYSTCGYPPTFQAARGTGRWRLCGSHAWRLRGRPAWQVTDLEAADV